MPQATGATPAAAAIPARVGRYTIRGVLGEGGMGTVYEAEQEQPRRVVALKVIRAGHLSPQLLRRFEHESLVLGRLQHPGIAHVYEAGTIEDERGNPVPYNLGSVLSGEGKHAAAEALLLPGAAVAAATLPTGHEVRVRLTRTITKLYEAWNTAEPGKGYDARAAEWNAKLKAMGRPAEQSGPE
ncbi:MAG TPA: hypothetical protein VGS03_13170 [Candidatus Polarisedimenticolia bacterium]|jgi:serine/threonine protein kinase|nr:hypothetical protein [Candidatus Polarisedimenticolia bacterium]